jgi:regulator of RNase E activity RraA
MLTAAQIEELKQLDTPTVANAIEFFDVQPKTAGFMRPGIRKVFENGRRMVGYAVTAKLSATTPPTEAQKPLAAQYYASIGVAPKPRVTVLQDLDREPTGSFWGEVQVSIHRALGCVGVVTNGGVRDLDEVKGLDFEYFASCLLVSHAYVHLEAVGCPVDIGGLTVHPGDLLHADIHGVVVIPAVVIPYLIDACRAAQDAETPVIGNCRKHFAAGDVDVARLAEWRAEMIARRGKALEKFSALLKAGK